MNNEVKSAHTPDGQKSIAMIRAERDELYEALRAIASGLTNGQKERGETFQTIARDALNWQAAKVKARALLSKV